MIGLVVLAIFAGYLFLAGKIAQFISGPSRSGEFNWKRGAIFLFIAVLPFADEIIGRLQFEHECKKAEQYAVTDAIRRARLAIEGKDLTVRESLHTLIPIERVTIVMVDATSGERLLTASAHFTYGGWIMRAGLNLGSFSSCHPEGGNIQLMKKFGFRLNEGGVYERGF